MPLMCTSKHGGKYEKWIGILSNYYLDCARVCVCVFERNLRGCLASSQLWLSKLISKGVLAMTFLFIYLRIYCPKCYFRTVECNLREIWLSFLAAWEIAWRLLWRVERNGRAAWGGVWTPFIVNYLLQLIFGFIYFCSTTIKDLWPKCSTRRDLISNVTLMIRLYNKTQL